MKQLYEVERTFYVMAEDAIPFNSDDDRTCGEILKGQRQLAGL